MKDKRQYLSLSAFQKDDDTTEYRYCGFSPKAALAFLKHYDQTGDVWLYLGHSSNELRGVDAYAWLTKAAEGSSTG